MGGATTYPGTAYLCRKYIENAIRGIAGDWNTATVKMGICTSALSPSVGASDPRWGPFGDQDYKASQVAITGAYPDGGIVITGKNIKDASGVVYTTYLVVDSPITLAGDSASPTSARWGVFYNADDPGKRVIGFIDLGAISLVPGLSLNISGVASGLATLYQLNFK